MSREHFPEKWAPVFRRKCDQVWKSIRVLPSIGHLRPVCRSRADIRGFGDPVPGAIPVRQRRDRRSFCRGGAVDVTGRVVAQALSKTLARTFVVINRPGANSNIGNLAVVRSKPDGYTLLVSSIGLAANAALYKNLPYDPLRDLSPISLLSNAPLGLFVNKDVPANNLREFVAYVQANPNKLDYASYGMGSSPHLAAELFQRVTGTKMIHIPFSGNAPATVATVSGTTQVIFCSTVAALPFVQNRRSQTDRVRRRSSLGPAAEPSDVQGAGRGLHHGHLVRPARSPEHTPIRDRYLEQGGARVARRPRVAEGDGDSRRSDRGTPRRTSLPNSCAPKVRASPR